LNITSYLECIDEETLLSLLKEGVINKRDLYNVKKIVNMFKRYELRTFFLSIIDVNREIYEDFAINTRGGKVFIRLPLFFKDEIIANIDNVDVFNSINTFIISARKDDVIYIFFRDKEKKVDELHYVFVANTGILVYKDQGVTIVETSKINYSYQLKEFLEEKIINWLPSAMKNIKDFERQVIERCILIKDIENITNLLEEFMFSRR